MGKTKEHPRYQIMTFRCSEPEAEELLADKPVHASNSEYLRELAAIGAAAKAKARELR